MIDDLDNLAKQLRDSNERFIFQGGSEFAIKLADTLEDQQRVLARNWQFRDSNERFIFQGGSEFAIKLADTLEDQQRVLARNWNSPVSLV